MTHVPTRVPPAFGLSPAAAELARRHRAMAEPYAIGSNPLLAHQQARESNARSYPRRIPLALRRSAGIYVEDVEGRVFIDCLAGAGTLALGHNHPVITAAIQAVLDSGAPLHTLDLTTPVKDRFMADLFDVLPPALAAGAKVQFCSPSGSDAIEAAMKLVRIATGRAGMVAFSGAYHGMTQGALGMMGSLGPKRALHGMLQNVQFAPYPYDYRCPFGLGGQAGVQAGLHYLDTLLSDPESGVPTPAGVVVEPVQGEGGVIPAPDAWLRGLREATARHDVPLIADEVQTGFGRTGRMFAVEHAGIVPDVLVLSKAIGGALPLSVVVYRGELDAWQPGAHAGTFRGNQMAMAAGSATLRFIRDEGLPEHAARMGERLATQLRALQEDIPALGDVRGRGLMLGVEIVQPAGGAADGAPAAAPELAQRLQALCLRHGLILELGGRHGSVVRFLPPLIIDASQIDDVARIFGDCARQVCGTALVADDKDPVVPM
ncbi:diaminobutyrate--2-oxoglutarate transaminase [Bordetella genomosp. 13]|uniref:diaminobutyrate--2-oxoglutarate transaminase n=1 Tax=Bordetella genomosp. 13 TaxID=463040 RepID=UPI0021B6422F|nr:diaminobutyrate--2-oxoglutarate transaminase [Bordetella genomosp. 13]